MTTAVFPGTFNPFTIGHEYIVNEALKVFDKVIILFAFNNEKEVGNSTYNQLQVKKYYENNSNILVDSYIGLTATYCAMHNACLIRGIRNTTDFEYEKTLNAFNAQYEISTYFIITPERLNFVSSTLVRSLKAINDESWKYYVPLNIYGQ